MRGCNETERVCVCEREYVRERGVCVQEFV